MVGKHDFKTWGTPDPRYLDCTTNAIIIWDLFQNNSGEEKVIHGGVGEQDGP